MKKLTLSLLLLCLSTSNAIALPSLKEIVKKNPSIITISAFIGSFLLCGLCVGDKQRQSQMFAELLGLAGIVSGTLLAAWNHYKNNTTNVIIPKILIYGGAGLFAGGFLSEMNKKQQPDIIITMSPEAILRLMKENSVEIKDNVVEISIS